MKMQLCFIMAMLIMGPNVAVPVYLAMLIRQFCFDNSVNYAKV